MTAICTLENLSLAFGGTPLFLKINSELPAGITGLVAPNGGGKSTLLKVLSSQIPIDSGHFTWKKPNHLVRQFYNLSSFKIVDFLEKGQLWKLFTRIEQGLATEEDFAAVADYWHIPLTWQRQLESVEITAPLDTPIEHLNGGQRTRLFLSHAFSKKNHYLLLDEPSNHLDREGREWLRNSLMQHPGGALVASHDRELLEYVNQIFELHQQGLRLYGGGYSSYQHRRNIEQAALLQKAQDNHKELRQINRIKQLSIQKFAERQRQGESKRNSQSKSLLDAQKNRAGRGFGKVKRRLEQRQLNLEIRQDALQARSRKETYRLKPQKLDIKTDDLRGGRRLHLENICLPRGSHKDPISLTLQSGDRWQVTGSNGSGKSTLLKIIAGQLKAKKGVCQHYGNYCYLDQDLSFLNKSLSALSNLNHLYPGRSEGHWRTMLATMRLRGDLALRPLKDLSGGEQLKVALLAATRGNPTTDLLLLDEPDNYLDLDSRRLLEKALVGFPGTFLLVSHDPIFIEAIGVNGQYKLE
ncbi:ATP-binding cassette domain-containing protein [Microbulbifer echini]|uniref:ATP-binding cassette domain-containing protein n=1 Tax=Microbulbifer echini TaxID=1529067 RepID=A0ABV4NKQ8_9GAMM